MTMTPRVRKLMLTAHLTTSLGWLGAVIAYIPLDVIATTGQDPRLVRAAYLSMDLIVRFAIVPLALAAMLTGIIQSLGTTWGLFRHYWVLVSLILTLLATTVLLIEANAIGHMAAEATSRPDPRAMSGSLFHSVGGLLVLLTVTILNIYKPRGLTRHGWRKQQEQRGEQHKQRTSPVT